MGEEDNGTADVHNRLRLIYINDIRIGRKTMEQTLGSLKLDVKEDSGDVFTVEYEILPPDINLIRTAEATEFLQKVDEIDVRTQELQDQVAALNANIERLTNHADGLDYTIAVASGMIAGIIDSVWVGEISIDRSNELGKEKIDSFVIKVAKSKGYKGDDLAGAVKYLEQNYPIAADKATNDFGGGLQHHLRDFSHHPTPVGLLFSLLTQFTEKVYGTDVTGTFRVANLDKSGFYLIGKNIPEKITFGVINWFFHMVSDMAGSSGSIDAGKLGTGLPGPIVSMLKEISVLPVFSKLDKRGYKEFSVWISKLFNGTLLGEHDENGKIVAPVKFDLRTEIGLVGELSKQAVPVVINECIVRGFYFVRRLSEEIKASKAKTISDLKYINWRDTLPFKNRTVARMLVISTGTFTVIDVADAAIRSGGFNAGCLLRVNFVGVGRFAIAVGADTVMGVKREKVRNERMHIMAEQLILMNAKLYYKTAVVFVAEQDVFDKQKEMWIAARSTTETLDMAYRSLEEAVVVYINTLAEINDYMEKISAYVPEIEKHNPGLTQKLKERLRWGE